MTTSTVQLTLAEAELLEHRLSIPDCIADAIGDYREDEDGNEVPCPWTRDQIEASTRGLLAQVESRRCIDLTDDLAVEIAEDCMSGSTFFADIDDAVATGELTKEQAAAYRSAAKSLCRKLSKAAGRKLDGFPPA
ncbi:conserved protein of unknown function (plasmid) [Rhodovastum atsumiense]|uniref:Uncharacterized protein n=1 Tax=Rhodovastum atsumiense TaxID=504468 RepID=A0A5M6ITL4_9PROT|nr:hypothetical protein [Rhodovastum atsumiense]KAA5611602.1 hypothetical protein F1189_13650 [Rhodovastum atsumiense]CAH2606313.1 conserved protein of unknown function [Rhodovastum atsumiense]